MQPVDPDWRLMYRIGAAAALMAAIVVRRNFAAELTLLAGLGIVRFAPAVPPVSAAEWFALLQESRLVGLWLLDIFDLVNYALVGLMYIALYGALRRVQRGTMMIATVLCFIGIAVFFASNQALPMLVLSKQYAAAATEAERFLLLAAGQARLAFNNSGATVQSTGFYASLFLVLAAGLIVSLVMAGSRVFNRLTAAMGFTANVLALGYFPVLVFVPSLQALPPSLSAPFRLAWYIMIALRLFRLARGEDQGVGVVT
jgi:hypothetical protein